MVSSVEEDLHDEIIKTEQTKSDLANVCELLLNDKFKRRKTRLRDRTIASLTTLDVLSQIYDVKFLQEWIDGYTEYITSVNGLGRQEIVDITKFSIAKEDERNKQLMEVLGNR